MSKRCISLFQIGPVQEFIETARKTQDLWSGSFLLSYLSALAIGKAEQEGGQVIFPATSGNMLLVQAKEDIEKLHFKRDIFPWYGSLTNFQPTLPNRFLVNWEKDPKTELAAIACSCQGIWEAIAEKVRMELEKGSPHLLAGSAWSDIWQRQIPQAFEMMYCWVPWDGEPNTYKDAFIQVEDLLGRRKATRWFASTLAEPGQKCSLCGFRQALGDDLHSKRRDLREFWEKKIRDIDGLSFRFDDGEHLCAVCTVKRLAPQMVFSRQRDVPSTSAVAVAPFIRDAEELSPTNELLIDSIAKLREQARDIAADLRESFEITPLPAFCENSTLGRLDGNWFYPETYEQLAAKEKAKGENAKQILLDNLASCKKALGKLTQELQEMERDRYRPPCKYYAVLLLDGDNMGTALSQIGSPEGHQRFSQQIADFSQGDATLAIQRDHLGYAIYMGGDEGLAFLPLEQLFEVMKTLRKAWRACIEKKGTFPSLPTLSLGVCIAHHQQSLRGILAETRGAMHYAKSIEGGKKDAFAVSILRRSGGPVRVRAKWTYLNMTDDHPAPLDTLDLLDQLRLSYIEGSLSPRWAYQLEEERTALEERLDLPGIGTRITSDEIPRLFDRHWDSKHFPIAVRDTRCKMVSQLFQGLSLASTQDALDHFLGLMDLAAYVAKGGGR